MYNIKNIFLVLILAIAVSGCSSVKKLDIFKTEVERAAECVNQVHLIEKIRKIPTLTLKYVATTQSLYI